MIAFTTPLFLAKSSSGPYFLFGACSLLTTLVCVAFQPETSGSSLEDVDETFSHSPWRTLLQNNPLTGLGRASRAHRRNTSNQVHVGEGDDEFELDVIHLPQVSFGGLWHYGHPLTDPRLSRLLQVQDTPDSDSPLF